MMTAMTSAPSRTLRLVGAAAGLAVAIGGCSWRAETPPIPSRTPTPTVVLRDAAAEREQAVIDTVDSSDAGVLEAGLAPERLEALGGIYVEHPSSSPSPSPAALSFEDAVAEAIDAALADASAADDEDPGLAAMLRSIALSHASVLAAEDLAGAEPAERPMPGSDGDGAWIPTSDTAVDGDALAALALAHDRAAFAYEVAAARAEGDERAQALVRSRIHAARAESLVALPGVEDRRTPLYDVPPIGTATAAGRAATEIEIETGLSEDYAALLDGAAAVDVTWILDAAFDAFAAAAALPGFDPQSIPALPGLTVAP
ncbi:hypothetical protein [Demequina iriomotensis]|uniref:hypothetical protein n=1 Tax=Demequina iriomotensis TaxID=1536641 RepID=UPI000780F521|nr:hypothetical protein [Demequina iriomotensis]